MSKQAQTVESQHEGKERLQPRVSAKVFRAVQNLAVQETSRQGVTVTSGRAASMLIVEALRARSIEI